MPACGNGPWIPVYLSQHGRVTITMFNYGSVEETRAGLERKGHTLGASLSQASLDVLMSADTIMTVAVRRDPTVKHEYRNRFFLCRPAPKSILGKTLSPTNRRKWLETIGRIGGRLQSNFLAGPGTWLLHHVCPDEKLLVWPQSGSTWYPELCNEVKGIIPTSVDPLPFVSGLQRSVGIGPLCLFPESGDFVQNFALCFLVSVLACNECFISNESYEAVYEVHHHEKIVISIPGQQSRDHLVEKMRGRPKIFLDASGYR
jgi:hypothetical protein